MFPSEDREFEAFVRAAIAGLPRPLTPEVLQHAVRRRYPAAVVRAQDDLARVGDAPAIWYVFRFGTLGGAPRIDLAGATDAWAVLDDERRFLEVGRGLAAIAEVPPAAMIGRTIDDLTNPADPTIREDLARMWEEFLRLRAIASTLRFDHLDGRHREVAYQLVADAAGPGRHRLVARVTEDE